MIRDLGKQNTIFNTFIAELRDATLQQDSMRFRRNLERVGEIMAYEVSKTLKYQEQEVITPLGTATVPVLQEYPVLIPILRAGLPLLQGMLNIFDRSACGFVSAYRKVDKNEDFTIKIEYVSAPELTGRTLILCDPMLATGSSLVASYKALLQYGRPEHTHIVSVIASTEGISTVRQFLPVDRITLWTGAVDSELTAKAYIVPGLGDAGDLAYGTKPEHH
ncbi:MAG: uracil phosphoribosyltransferase [Bacteroidales bacterium]